MDQGKLPGFITAGLVLGLWACQQPSRICFDFAHWKWARDSLRSNIGEVSQSNPAQFPSHSAKYWFISGLYGNEDWCLYAEFHLLCTILLFLFPSRMYGPKWFAWFLTLRTSRSRHALHPIGLIQILFTSPQGPGWIMDLVDLCRRIQLNSLINRGPIPWKNGYHNNFRPDLSATSSGWIMDLVDHWSRIQLNLLIKSGPIPWKNGYHNNFRQKCYVFLFLRKHRLSLAKWIPIMRRFIQLPNIYPLKFLRKCLEKITK